MKISYIGRKVKNPKLKTFVNLKSIFFIQSKLLTETLLKERKSDKQCMVYFKYAYCQLLPVKCFQLDLLIFCVNQRYVWIGRDLNIAINFVHGRLPGREKCLFRCPISNFFLVARYRFLTSFLWSISNSSRTDLSKWQKGYYYLVARSMRCFKGIIGGILPHSFIVSYYPYFHERIRRIGLGFLILVGVFGSQEFKYHLLNQVA